MRIKYLLSIVTIMASYSCNGPELPPQPDSNGIAVNSVTATIRSMPYKSGNEGNSLFAACDIAQRHNAGQKMHLCIGSSSYAYTYDGTKWIPENEAALFTENKASEVEISLSGGEDAWIVSDQVRYFNSATSPSPKLDGIVLDHTRSLVEFLFTGSQPDNRNEVRIAGNTVLYDDAQKVYFAFVEPGLVSLKVTFTYNGAPYQYAYSCPAGLEAGYAYRFSIETSERVTSLKSISGSIAHGILVSENGSESELENEYDFGRRFTAGQILEATFGSILTIYNYDMSSDKWIPAQGEGLVYQNNETGDLKLSIKPRVEVSQDGSENTFISADELKCTISNFAPLNDLTNVIFTRSNPIVEISAEEGVLQLGTQLCIGSEIALFDNITSKYRIITKAGITSAEVSYTDNNGACHSITISPEGGLKSNHIYQASITKEDPIIKSTSLKSVKGINSDFADRYQAGQKMYITIDESEPAEYLYNGSEWVPAGGPAEFDGSKQTYDLSIVIKSGSGLAQDGTYYGLLRCDELQYNANAQPASETIDGIELKRTNVLLEITFDGVTPKDDIVTINGNIRPFSRSVNKEGVNRYISSAIIPAGTQSVTLALSFDGSEGKTYTFTPPGGFTAGNIYTETISYKSAQPGYTEGTGDSADAPIVLHDRKDNTLVRVISVGRQGNIIDVTLPKSDIRTLSVITNDGKHFFEVDINSAIVNGSAWEFTQPAKVLAASDFNGNFDAFHAFLSGNGVIDAGFNWTYGNNHVVITGDATGLGRNDLAILWLCYKLDRQAAAAGGRLHYLVGDEDEKILRYNSDTGNSANSYKQFYSRIVQNYRELWADNSELGNWLGGRNVAVKIGNDIFIHGGLHRGLIEAGYTIEEINTLFKSNARIASRSARSTAVFASATETMPGPIACRNYIDSCYGKVPINDLNYVLEKCEAEKMIIGNCTVSDVKYADLANYGNRVIAIAVDHTKYAYNTSRERSAGMLVENGTYYSVSYKGSKAMLDQW